MSFLDKIEEIVVKFCAMSFLYLCYFNKRYTLMRDDNMAGIFNLSYVRLNFGESFLYETI